ncbi:macro domain-containing protein [[Kitasatospora] papulosa]|uniref:DUF6430 domain-containing protein n=1 Tax=Streptomyces sp. NBC_00148 TaxID=2903626 RepID=A0AAU1LUN5_9ACTN
MRQEAREVLLTKSGISAASTAILVAFGFLSAIFQVALAVWPSLAQHDILILSALACSCIAAGVFRVWPKFETTHRYNYPSFAIHVKCGDVLSEKSFVVGFTDTFDTDTTGGLVINPRSVQGQFQSSFYGDETARLASEIQEELQTVTVVKQETRLTKPKGNLDRYPVGTTVVLRPRDTTIYASAYGYMRNDLRVSCSVDSLWTSLTSVWDAVREHNSLEPVAVPVIGSELARVGSLDRNSLIKMIALSFIASSREEVVSRQLTIVVHPKDRSLVNLLDIDTFLRSL